MRIEQEKIPSAEEVLIKEIGKSDIDCSFGIITEEVNIFPDIIIVMKDYLNLHKKAIRYEYNEYNQYQSFLDGYKNGSASISEVNEAHDRFLKLLEI